MNDYLNSSNSAGGISVIKKFGSFAAWQPNQSSVPPVLPDVFAVYSFTKAQKAIEVQGNTVSFKFPKVNEMLSEYCLQCLPAICTLAFIGLVNEEFPKPSSDSIADQTSFPEIFPISDARLESVIGLYNRVYNQPKISAEAERTLSYYFGGSTNWLGLLNLKSSESKISELQNYLKNLETTYIKRLIDEILPATATDLEGKPIGASVLKWCNEKKGGKILDEEAARFFIDRANAEMSADVKIEFAKNRLRAIMFYADPIISDDRFRLSLEDNRWNEYDETIKKEVAFYNRKFAATPGFAALDWRLVKAMIWTEVMAGPKNNPKQWQTFPMQIGRFSKDAGYDVVSKGLDNSDLIVSAELLQELQNKAGVVGNTNVKAGIAYLYTKAIDGKILRRDVIDDPQVFSDAVRKGENGLDAIAKRLGTTTDNIIKNTTGLTKISTLQPDQEIKYQKAHVEKYISGWIDWETAMRNYNSKTPDVKGDVKYVDKFNRAYQIIISRTAK